jgi:proline iminopeptidase
MAYRRDNKADSELAQLSADYSDEEIRRIWDGNDFAEPYVLPQLLGTNLDSIAKLDVPVLVLAGRHDMNVNANVAYEWLVQLWAPDKQFVWFEHSGHIPMTEEPGKYLLSHVKYARPIAERAGDVPVQ